MTVAGTGVLGYGWDTASGPPTFNAFPLSSPPECSTAQPGGCPAGYATYLAGSGGAVDLSYSADGGHSFSTGVLNANSAGSADNLTSAVNAAGQGWAAWTDNGSVFASSFQALYAISSAKTSGGATSNGSTVTLNVTCAAFPCTVTIVLTAPETVVVHAASVPKVSALISTQIEHHTTKVTKTLTLTFKPKGKK